MAEKDSKRCSDIRQRVSSWDEYWKQNRTSYYEWNDFVMGDQWREDQAKLFERYNKIPLTMNKLGVLMNNLKGDQIQNTPNLQISPEEDVSAEEAEIFSALIKQIMFNSDSKTVFQVAYGQSIVGGYSAFRIGQEYINEFSFDQHIKLYGTTDPNKYYWDKSSQNICKTDGKFAGFKTRMSREMFSDTYGKDIEEQIGASAVTEDSYPMSFSDDNSITIINDYEKVKVKDFHTIYKLSDGSTVTNKEFDALERVKVDGKKFLLKDGNMVTILDKRKVTKYKIVHTQIAGDFVLNETDFPCSILPIIFVDQDSYYTKDGRQITRSFFKDVKDSQIYLNYIATQSAYMMKISRYDQFIMPRKCAAAPDTQQQWRDPSIVNGALYYDETPSGAKPEPLRPPELSQSLLTQYERTLMDIQSGTGLYNTQMGEVGNEISGAAIRRRNMRGNKNSQISRTSIERAIGSAGEVIVDMIPKVYDTHRTLILSTSQSSEEKVEINKPLDEYGLQIQNDLTKGRYKIYIKAGLSYEGQKEEALDSLQSVLMADKSGNVFPMIADMYVENLPLDNNIEIRNRLRTLVPPQIIEAGKTGKPMPEQPKEPSPEQIMLQLKQQELQLKAQQTQADMKRKMQELELRKAEIQRKAIESHQDMSLAWERLEAEKEEAAAELQAAMLRYEGEMQRIGADINISESQNLIKLLTHQNKQKENAGIKL